MTSPILVGGTAVKGERSESRSDAEGALDGRDEDQTIQLGRGRGPNHAGKEEWIMERLLLSPDQVAEALGVCRSRVYDLMRTRVLPSVKIGRARRVPVSAVRAYVDQLTDSWDLS